VQLLYAGSHNYKRENSRGQIFILVLSGPPFVFVFHHDYLVQTWNIADMQSPFK